MSWEVEGDEEDWRDKVDQGGGTEVRWLEPTTSWVKTVEDT